MASYAIPADMAPSPITAMASPRPVSQFPPKSRATEKPKAALIEVLECAAPKASYSLSLLFVKPLRPFFCLKVRMRSRRPVKIL